MATYTKNTSMGGAWVDKTKVKTGTKVKIVTEAVPTEEVFQGQPKTRNVVKLRIQGDEETKNFDLNKPTINGLIEAFGEDSKNWMGQTLTAETMRVIVAGKMGTSMYLVPDGFEFATDAGGYVVIQRIGAGAPAAPVTPAAAITAPASALADEFEEEDIPFGEEEAGEEEIKPEDVTF